MRLRVKRYCSAGNWALQSRYIIMLNDFTASSLTGLKPEPSSRPWRASPRGDIEMCRRVIGWYFCWVRLEDVIAPIMSMISLTKHSSPAFLDSRDTEYQVRQFPRCTPYFSNFTYVSGFIGRCGEILSSPVHSRCVDRWVLELSIRL
jgi:hypothetical protein